MKSRDLVAHLFLLITKPPVPTIRAWSRGEEIANSLCHGIAFFAVLGGAPWLLFAAGKMGGETVLAVGLFLVSAAAVYLFSTLHHALPIGRHKDRFETLDRAAIFLLIAGTYTPVAFTLLRGPWGLSLLGVVWALAVTGVVLRTNRTLQCPRITIGLYVLMGWLMTAAKPFWTHLHSTGVLLLLAGGVAYTGGLVFYGARRLRYHHLLWHLAVVVGTASHYFAILWFLTAMAGPANQP